MINDTVTFGPMYLDILIKPNRRVNLSYSREWQLPDYQLTATGFILNGNYDDRDLQLTISGDIRSGLSRIEIDGEEIEGTYTTSIGGSTPNFTVQLRNLGLNPRLIGRVGKDRYGNRLNSQLKEQCECSLLEADARQTLGINILDPETGQFAPIVTGSSNQQLAFEDLDPLLKVILTGNQFVYAGGFFKLRQLFSFYSQIFKDARDRNCMVVLDHGRFLGKPSSPEYREGLSFVRDSLQHVDFYLPNQSEIIELTGRPDLEDALRSAKDLGPKFVVCKTGERGCSFIADDYKVYHVPQEHKPREIVHTVGAGDSFNAGLIKGLKEGLDVENATRLGNTTAFLRISRGVPPSYQEVQELFT